MSDERDRTSSPEGLFPPPAVVWRPLLEQALAEDLGRAGDLTTDAVVPEDRWAEAEVVARTEGRIAGLVPALAVFPLVDGRCRTEVTVADGRDAEAGQVIARVRGPARALLTAERTALNLLGHLAGIATATRTLVRAVGENPARIADTRKTTPGLRALEKWAVRAGGGANHRFGLDDAVLIKDNHLLLAGGVTAALERARQRVGHLVKIELEVDTLEQLEEALATRREDDDRPLVDAVLLDNMTQEQLTDAVRRCRERDPGILTEASGSVTLDTVAAVAASGVDLISVGWITHSAPALDVALDIRPEAEDSRLGFSA